MDKYIPTIGLEIHAELKTSTKMFCDCKNDPNEERPNVNICPVCLSHPGSLPVINKEAVKSILKVGIALNGKLADLTEFDRKNYFYPDIPKGYQISQYKHPLVLGGILANVSITRVHLEEDTGTSMHDKGDYSLINYNRAGVPLMELVTDPVIHDAQSAVAFAKELQMLLRYLGVGEANMEKGEMRVEANISVSKTSTLGTKVEIKNLNSFKVAEKAINYEIERQIQLLERGEKVVQETRGWNEANEETFSQREKEDSHDYRYFPDPDLPKIKISEVKELSTEELKKEIPELPKDKKSRYLSEFNIDEKNIEFYLANREYADFFEACAKLIKKNGSKDFQILSNYIVSDLVSLGDAYKKIKAEHFAELILMLVQNKISSRAAKDLIIKLIDSEKNPNDIAIENNLLQNSDEDSVEKIVDQIISENSKIINEYKSGKDSSIQFLIGQGMKLSKGSANPQVLRKILEQKLR